jgi:hypothetical protein
VSDFFGSLGPFGWIVIALGLFGVVTLPRALREMWTRPWKKNWKDNDPPPGSGL